MWSRGKFFLGWWGYPVCYYNGRSMTFWTAGSIIMYVYILSLHSQFRDWSIKNPWSFMHDQCVIVMLIRWLLIGAGLRWKGALENFMVEADHQKDQAWDRGLVLSAPLPNLWQGEGAEEWVHLWASNIIHPTYVTKPQIKNLNTRAWWSFLVSEHIKVPGEWSTSKSTARASSPGDSSRPCSMYLSTWQFICVLYNKTTIQSTVLPVTSS